MTVDQLRKCGHGTKGLNAEEITEQFVILSQCKRDKAMLKQLLDYFALLENFRKAAQAGRSGRGSPRNPRCFSAFLVR